MNAEGIFFHDGRMRKESFSRGEHLHHKKLCLVSQKKKPGCVMSGKKKLRPRLFFVSRSPFRGSLVEHRKPGQQIQKPG